MEGTVWNSWLLQKILPNLWFRLGCLEKIQVRYKYQQNQPITILSPTTTDNQNRYQLANFLYTHIVHTK